MIAKLLLLLATVNGECHPCAYSEAGVGLTQHFEGYSPFVYEDVAGKQTIGFGHLVRPGEHFDEPLLPDEATELLRRDIVAAEAAVNRMIVTRIKQGQYDALTDLVFNLGPKPLTNKNSAGATIADMVNSNEHVMVTKRMLSWNKALVGGVLQPVKGLTRRREAEIQFYEAGE